jgi:hypothetical protein
VHGALVWVPAFALVDAHILIPPEDPVCGLGIPK